MNPTVDILIVGGGPAGSMVAAALAPRHTVLMIDRSIRDHAAEGETLAPAARRILDDVGLADVLDDDAHRPISLRRWSWGDTDELDAIRDLDGPHHLVDRQRFDGALRSAAAGRGAVVRRGRRLGEVARVGDRWDAEIVDEPTGRVIRIGARVLVDATGRRRSAARRVRARHETAGQLVSRWVIGRQPDAHPGTTDVSADPDGWWFSTALPGGRRLLSWQTDVDLLPTVNDAGLVEAARRNDAIGRLLDGFVPTDARGTRPAAMTRLDRVVGDDWLAVGDAAVALDPLSSQGLFAALFTGFSAAATIDGALAGDPTAWAEYQHTVDAIWARNRTLLHVVYRAEQRWADRPFWARRTAAAHPVISGIDQPAVV